MPVAARASSSTGSGADPSYPLAIIDTGAHSLRITLQVSPTSPPFHHTCSNAIVRNRNKDVYIGSDIDERCHDYAGLTIRLPIERGFLTDWAAQKAIWDGEIERALAAMPSSSRAATGGDRLLEGWTAIVTEAYFNFTELEAGLDAFWFEEYGVKSLWRTPPAQLASFAPLTPLQAVESKNADMTALDTATSPPLLPAGSPDVAEVAMSPPAAESGRQSVENKSMPPPPSSRRPKRQSAAADAATPPAKKTKTASSAQAPRHRRPEACVVVDMSHSATHIVPLLFGEVVWAGVKRLDIGGKAMTNLLKETISFKQWDMMEESWIVSHLKEQTMFVAASVHEEDKSKPSCWSPQELLANRKAIEQEILLPDYSDLKVARDPKARYGHIRAGPSGDSGDDFVADLSRAKSANATRQGDNGGSDEDDDEGEDYRESGSESETDRVVKAPSKKQSATKAKPRQTDDTEEQQVLLLSHERWQIPELLFQPHQIGE